MIIIMKMLYIVSFIVMMSIISTNTAVIRLVPLQHRMALDFSNKELVNRCVQNCIHQCNNHNLYTQGAYQKYQLPMVNNKQSWSKSPNEVHDGQKADDQEFNGEGLIDPR